MIKKNRIAKIAGVAVGATLALGAFVPIASAQTVAELQAQINALLAQLSALQGGSSTGAAACAFARSLTVGSSGADVTCLQNYLKATGHFTFSGGATGYFGPITKAAVAAWQAANGVSPAVGYFGPISQAKYSAMSGGTTGTPTTPGTTGGISTPGVEGTITVSKNPNPASGTKLYEADDMIGVMGIKLEAKTSDIKVERVKVDLDAATGGNNDQDLYNKIADKIYVMDGSTVLASMDLNSSTVVKDGTDYFITVAGFSFIVPKDSTKVLTVGLRARNTWDSTYDTDSWTLGVPIDGLRGIDGAGINQYGPATAFTNSFTTEGDLSESATLTISTASDSPQDQGVVCTLSSTEDECDKLELLKLVLKAEKDDVLLTDLDMYLQKTGTGSATTTTGYLYDGSTLVGSATIFNQSPGGGVSVRFTDIDYTVMKDAQKTLSFQVDVQDTTIGASVYSASTTGSLATAENMKGTAITESGTAIGESLEVRKIGPEFSLVSKSITYTPSGGFAGATSSAKADFVIRMKAVGGDIVFGDSASTTYPLVVLGIPTGAGSTATSTVIYRGGAAVSGSTIANNLNNVSSSTAITVPSGPTATTSNSWTLAEGNTVDIPVSMVFNARSGNAATLADGAEVTTGAYAVQINNLFWATAADVGERHVSDWMSGNSAWRTGTVTLP
jgi:peptidoglycan hydrolase-like protein with peptidoglycan-binding domain